MRLLLFVLALVPGIAAAQAPVPASAASMSATQPPVKVKAISLRPSDPARYPPALSSAGVQGTTLVLAELTETGVPVTVTVAQSSRSAELDTTALAIVKSVAFRAREPAVQSLQVLVPVEFRRDSVATLGQKTCGEFNIDVPYFKTTFPEVEPKEMTVVNMAVGVLFMARGTGATADAVNYAKSLSAALPRVVASCASQPEAKFLETFKQEARAGGG